MGDTENTPRALGSMAVNDLLEALASKTPAPGGGAAAGVAGATACGLASMVINYSLGKKRFAEHEAALTEHGAFFERARGLLMQLADEDAAAFPALQAAQKLPDDDPGKARAVTMATDAAIGAPRATLAAAADVLRRLERLPAITNRHLASDLAIAALLAETAAASAAWNVRVNLGLLNDEQAWAIEAETTTLVREAGERRRAVELACVA
ncbi:MAG: cyclodeaminase/cyclohydrolase family protein [Planctomycetota bacterium]